MDTEEKVITTCIITEYNLVQRLQRTRIKRKPGKSCLFFFDVFYQLAAGVVVLAGLDGKVGLWTSECLVAPEPPVYHSDDLEWAVK